VAQSQAVCIFAVESDQAEGLFEFASRTHFKNLHFYNVNNQAIARPSHLCWMSVLA
jgi:hypothetical protein